MQILCLYQRYLKYITDKSKVNQRQISGISQVYNRKISCTYYSPTKYGQFQNCYILAHVGSGGRTVIIRLNLSSQLNLHRTCQLELSLMITLQVEVVRITAFKESLIHFFTTASGTLSWAPSTSIPLFQKIFSGQQNIKQASFDPFHGTLLKVPQV